MKTERPITDAHLQIDHVEIDYQKRTEGAVFRAVEDATFDVPARSFVSLVGPSGCGKSSLLYAVAGLVPYSGGEIRLGAQRVSGPGADRSVVFQSASLLPWRNTLRNVTYGLELRGTQRREATEIARGLIRLVGLEGSEDKYPHELSGGMQQRVNVARALAVDPKLLLLDEPFAALDAQTRELMQAELLRIWTDTHQTALFVTHQIDEAVFLSDRVVVMGGGPGSRVKEVVPIDFDRPREPDLRWDPEFASQVQYVSDLIDRVGTPTS